MVGAHNILVSKHTIDTYRASGIVTDIWVANQVEEMHWLQKQDTMVTTDFLFSEYLAFRGKSQSAGGSSSAK